MNKRRNKKAFKAIQLLNLTLPEVLIEYLTTDQETLLKCVLANYTIEDMVRFTKYGRSVIIEELMLLGRTLSTYELLECKIFPENVPNTAYLKGWNDCKKFIRRSIYDKTEWQTIKDRN